MAASFRFSICFALALLFVSVAAFPQEAATIPGLPGTLNWSNAAGSSWKFDNASKTLAISGGPKTDWFVEPVSGSVATSGPTLLFQPGPDYVFSARVSVNFAAKYDSGALLLWADDHHWSKLSFEFSPAGRPAVSTVVTKGTSDTWNSAELKSDADAEYLRIAKSANVYILYSSPDGSTWQKLRTFSLDTALPVQLGFQAQSPAGAGTVAKFSSIAYDPRRIESY